MNVYNIYIYIYTYIKLKQRCSHSTSTEMPFDNDYTQSQTQLIQTHSQQIEPTKWLPVPIFQPQHDWIDLKELDPVSQQTIPVKQWN